MTPVDLRNARKHLGLTQKGLAKALRMGTHGWQSISKWERDSSTIPGPVQVAVESMLRELEAVARVLCAANFAKEGCEGEFGNVDDCWWAFTDEAIAVNAQGIETAKPPRRAAGLAREGESPVAAGDAPTPDPIGEHHDRD